MDFLKWYKDKIETARPEPPVRVWDEIQTQLDIERVWKGIDTEMHSAKIKKLYFRFSLAASALVILALGTFLYSELGSRHSLNFYAVENNTHNTIRGSLHKKPFLNLSPSKILEFPEAKEISPGQDKTLYLPIPTTESPMDDLPRLAYAHDQINLKKPVINSFNIPDYLNGRKIKSQGKETITDGYYIGVSGHLANTWLMNNKTMQGLRSDELTASLPSFGYNFGIIAGKNITTKFEIQAELYIISMTRQNYNEYIHGKYINNNMQFNYFNFGISARWYFAETRNLGRHALIFGAHKGLLKNVFQDIDGESISLNNEYRSTDHGIVAGYEYLHPVFNKLSVATGFQTRIGLRNIFEGNELVPDYLNVTRNTSINLTLSLRYNSR